MVRTSIFFLLAVLSLLTTLSTSNSLGEGCSDKFSKKLSTEMEHLLTICNSLECFKLSDIPSEIRSFLAKHPNIRQKEGAAAGAGEYVWTKKDAPKEKYDFERKDPKFSSSDEISSEMGHLLTICNMVECFNLGSVPSAVATFLAKHPNIRQKEAEAAGAGEYFWTTRDAPKEYYDYDEEDD